MIRNNSNILIGVFFFLFMSYCVGDSENRREIDSMKLSITETRIKIPIDSQTFPQSGCSYSFTSKNGTNYLTYLNKQFNEIHFYYIDSIKLAFKVKIDVDGPNGIGSAIRGFWVHDLDSIYVTPKARKIIYLVNSRGEIINKINYGKYDSNAIVRDKMNSMMAFYSRPEIPLIILNNSLFISMFPEGNWNNFSLEELTSKELTFSLNPEDRKVNVLPVSYPASAYQKNNLGYSRVFGDGVFVYSFNTDHHIYVTKNHRNFEKHLAKSNYFSSIEEYPRNGSFQEYFLKQVNSPSYKRIIFDQYRKVYYRIAYPGYTAKRDDNLRELIDFLPQFSIIILDQDFNIIGETLVPLNKFDMGDLFVTEEGLHISGNHIKNPDFNPDFLIFHLLNLVKNEN